MIAFLKGILHSKQQNSVIIEVQGIGYQVYVPDSLLNQLFSVGEEIMLYTYQQWKEDGIFLFGFEGEEALAFFKLLISVNGVGPKGALAILSNIGADNLPSVILGENLALLSKAPGIGKKTAQRIVLDLKDKLGKSLILEDSLSKKDGNQVSQAVEALIGLGYKIGEASGVVQAIFTKGNCSSLENLLQESLKELGKRK